MGLLQFLPTKTHRGSSSDVTNYPSECIVVCVLCLNVSVICAFIRFRGIVGLENGTGSGLGAITLPSTSTNIKPG